MIPWTGMFHRNKTAELVVKKRVSPRVKVLAAAGVAAALTLAAGWFYSYGSSMAGFDRTSTDRELQALRDETRRLQGENQDLQEGLARAQRALQMDQTAYQELDHALKNSAQEIVKLREELNFYRNIISPEDKRAGLRIQNLIIEPAGGVNQFRYKLVLIQALKHERSIYGSASFEISGTQAGQDTVLKFPTPAQRPVSVNFKYFQDIEGRFELPRNFKPRQIKVVVLTSGGGQSVEETFAWPRSG